MKESCSVVLSEEDANLFYEIMLPLLDHTNRVHLKKGRRGLLLKDVIDPEAAADAADHLWANTEIIDEYLEIHPELSEEHRNILLSWKRRIRGVFAMERHLKNGTILICLDDNRVYRAVGIVSSWKDLATAEQLPLILSTTLLPFKDVIISDGLITPYTFVVGREMKRQFAELYMDAKKKNHIHTSL